MEKIFEATGRRKEAVAHIWLQEGTGNITVNKRHLDDYYPLESAKFNLLLPLREAGLVDKVDIKIRVKGGGISGQANATKLAIAKALILYQPEFRGRLKASGLLMRDSRVKERKKYGQPKARKNFQFSKR